MSIWSNYAEDEFLIVSISRTVSSVFENPSTQNSLLSSFPVVQVRSESGLILTERTEGDQTELGASLLSQRFAISSLGGV